ESEPKRDSKRKADLVRFEIAVEPAVRPPCLANELPQSEFGLYGFSLAHAVWAADAADSSELIALITASVEICFMETRALPGEDSLTGVVDSPCKIKARLSRGRQ